MQQSDFQQLTDLIPNVSHETYQTLGHFADMLWQWQKHINLVANSTINDIWQRHILDSAQLFLFAPQAQHWLDLGSGGGFPALVLACLLKQQNQQSGAGASVTLIESNGKKAAFLREVIRRLELPAIVHQARIETILPKLPVPEIITARALSSLDALCGYIAPLMARPGGKACHALLQKGQSAAAEISEARRNWQFSIDIFPSRLQNESSVLVIRHIQPLSPIE